MIIPEATQAIQALHSAIQLGGVPPARLELVYLRASQINVTTREVAGAWR